MRKPSFTRYSSLVTHHSLLITHYSSLVTHHSLLITRYSSLVTHHSLLITRYSSLRSPVRCPNRTLPANGGLTRDAHVGAEGSLRGAAPCERRPRAGMLRAPAHAHAS